MAGLVICDLGPVFEKVKMVLKGFPLVAGAYLFGSILGPCRPDSDIDLGLVLEKEVRPDTVGGDRLEASIALALPPVDGHPFDLVLLNPDRPIFAFRVIKEGKLVYCRNMDRITDVVEYVSRCYGELYPRYRNALKEIIDEVMEGGS